MPATEASLLAADSTFAAETAVGGAAAWTSWFDTAGAMIGPTGEVRGHTDIRAAMEPTLTDAIQFTWSPERAIVGDGDLGVTTGSYQVVAVATGTVMDHGRYLSVWRRQEDGSWKVVADIGAAAPRAPVVESAPSTPADSSDRP